MFGNYKNIVYQLLYFACIGVTFLNNYELTFLIWFMTLLLTVKRTYTVTILKYVSCFVLILSIAFFGSLFREHGIYDIIRDITYLLKPVVGMLAGYQLCKFNRERALKLFVYTGLIIAVIHLIIIAIASVKYQTLNVNLIRKEAGYFSDYEIYALIILIFRNNLKLVFSKINAWSFMLVLGISCFLYLSRTNLIQIIILYIALKGYFTVNKKSVQVLASIVLAVLVGYSAILYINPKRNGEGLEAFLYKVKIAPIEPFKTKIDKGDWKDFNDNYRSYENIITIKQVTNDGWNSIFFGEGLGSKLNLGRKVLSNDGEYVQYIPYVHNGFMTVFLKSGLLGVCISVFFIILLFRQKKSDIESVRHINYLLIGTSVFLIVSNWVFLGLYLKLDNKSIIIGFLLALREITIRENQSQKGINNG
ncbi:hypothetical protein [Flavobacterium pedocola]